MAKTKGARQFGNIRKQPSGRFQVRYTGPDGISRSAAHTFERKRDASRWLSLGEAEILKGEWIAPELGAQKFREFAETWLRDRVLKPRTAELYADLLANHLYPTFGGLSLCDIDVAAVRRWRKAQGATAGWFYCQAAVRGIDGSQSVPAAACHLRDGG